MYYWMHSKVTVIAMANCKRCGRNVGCDCNLQLGKYCSRCYEILKQENGNEKKLIEAENNACGQSLESLNALLNELKERPKDQSTIYLIAIVNSQIAQFANNPCAYEEIIKKIK